MMRKSILALGMALCFALGVFAACAPVEEPDISADLKQTQAFSDVVVGYSGQNNEYVLNLSEYFESDKDIVYSLSNSNKLISDATVSNGKIKVKLSGEGTDKIDVTAKSGDKQLNASFNVTSRRFTKVACLGDSLTYGHSWHTESYPVYLQEDLTEAYTVQNYGKNGATVTGYAKNEDPSSSSNPKYDTLTEYSNSLKFSPDVVVIMLGTNDSRGWNYAESRFEEDYSSLIDSYRMNDKDARILIVSSPITANNNSFGIPGNVIKQSVNPLQKKAADEKGLYFLDFADLFENYAGGYSQLLRNDGVHLSVLGAQYLAERVAEKVTRIASEVTVAGNVPDVPQKSNEVDVVLFTGQSNMVGRETSKYTAFIPKGMAYEYKSATDSLDEVKNPVGETFGNVEVSSGSSLVPQFCSYYVATTGRKIVAVHLARGGRKIELFAQSGTIYKDIISKVGACFDYLAQNNYTVGRKFYVMYQGESDTGSTSAETYKSLYESFHSGIVNAFGFEFGAMIYNGRDSVETVEGIARINAVKKTMAEERDDLIICDKGPASYYIKNTELMRSDNVHLNAEGLKKVGADSCTNIVNYLGYGKDKSLKGVDPVTYLEEPEKAPEPIVSGECEWNFDNGDMSEKNGRVTLTKGGIGSPVFRDGKYVHTDEPAVYYTLSAPIVLSASKNWSMEWKGYSTREMNGDASILISNGLNTFITFQKTHGIYVRKDNAKAQFGSKINLEDIYAEHVWKLVYSPGNNTVELFEDGVSRGTLAWSTDITVTHLLGCSVNNGINNYYSFTGELDYLKINLG